MVDNTTEAHNRLSDKVDKVIGDINTQYVKKEDLQHYASKHFVWGMIATAGIAICGAYIFVTPLLVDSKTNILDKNIERILEILEPKPEDHKNSQPPPK